jgi:cytoplasmic iron level regulating protein YaaA (DUF328/UPF0246 family)
MIILLSPAKSLNLDPSPIKRFTLPDNEKDTAILVKRMRRLKAPAIQKLMSVSPAIANLNVDRYAQFEPEYELDRNAKQALYSFNGDVYRDWPLSEYSDEDLDFAQKRVRILSGLYGLLRPLDLMQPYRLEMGTRLKTRRGDDLYSFWGDRITKTVNQAAADAEAPAVLNLASIEYFKSVQPTKLKVPVVSPVFKDWKTDKFKIISFYAKRARGMMAHYVVSRRVTDPEGLMGFTLDGYAYDPASSTPETPVFLRRLER